MSGKFSWFTMLSLSIRQWWRRPSSFQLWQELEEEKRWHVTAERFSGKLLDELRKKDVEIAILKKELAFHKERSETWSDFAARRRDAQERRTN